MDINSRANYKTVTLAEVIFNLNPSEVQTKVHRRSPDRGYPVFLKKGMMFLSGEMDLSGKYTFVAS